MGLFTKKRKEDQNATSGHLTAPSVTSPSRNSTSSNSRPAPVPASASPFLYGESHGPSFKLVQGRKRRDSDLSIRSSRTTAAAAPTAAASSGSRLSPYASRSDAGGSGFQRSFDSLPLPSKSKSTYAAASASAGPRHGVSPLRAEATEDGRSTSSKSGGRSTFGALFKKRPQHAHKPDSTASSSSQSTSFSKLDLDPPASSDFNLRSFRSGSSSSTTTTANTASTKPGPTPLQPSLQHQQSRLSTDAVSTLDDASLPAPSPAFAYGSSSPRNSRLGQSPGHRPMSPSQSSISVSQFNQAKAMRSGNASLRSASSVSSLNQMANNQPTPSSASPQPPPKDEAPSSGRPAPAQTPVKRHSQGPPLSRPSSSRLDLPLPTPSRVAPARPLPQRRTSSIDPTMDVYADYFSSPVTTPADDLFPAKHNFFGPPSRGHSPMPSSTAVNTLTSSPPKSDDRSLLPPAPIVDPEAATADQKRSPERPFSQRTLSGSSLLDVASGFGASLSTYLSSVGQDGEPAVAASAAAADKENRQAKRAERTKSRLMGKHAWGADSDSDEDAQEEVGSDDASSSGEGGALQMSTKRPQTSTTPRTPQAAPASAAWESDDAVIKREEARKQALLAQISPFTRSSYAPPSPSASTPQTTPKAPVVPKSASPFSARLQEAAKSAAAAAPPAPAPVAAAAPMPLHEENLEILNTANRNDSAVDDDDDDEAPLASIAAKSSHHRAQSELCFPSSSRMSFANSVMGGPPQMSMPFQQHFAQMGGSFMSPQPASSALSPQSSTPDLRLRTHSHAGQAKEKPSLSALVDAYRNADPNMPVNMAPPSMGHVPRRPESTLSVQSRTSKRSLSAGNVPTVSLRNSAHMSVSSLSSAGPATPGDDGQSVHQRMASRHKAEAMKHSSSLIHVAEPSGKLPPPLPDSKAHGPMLPSAGMHGGFPPAQTLHPGHMGVLPGIDPNIWANLSPDQRLNLAMNQLAMYQSAQAMQFMAMSSGSVAGGSVVGMPTSGSMVGLPQPQAASWGGTWGNGSVMSGYAPPQAPFAAGSHMSTSSRRGPGSNTHSFINQR